MCENPYDKHPQLPAKGDGEPEGENSLSTPKDAEALEQYRGEHLDALFAGLPDDPTSHLNAVVSLQRSFRKKAAEDLKPVVNALLRGNPPISFVAKQVLSASINAALHELGLGIIRSDTDHPQSVTAIRGRAGQSGWLKLQHRKKPPIGEKRISAPTNKLDELRLVEALREEPLQGKQSSSPLKYCPLPGIDVG